MTLRISPLWAALIVVLPLLSGCASTDDDAPAKAAASGCPRTGLMPGADRLPVFEDMANPSRETVTVKAQLYGITYTCKPVPKRGEVEVNLNLRFVADRMPLAGSLKGLTLPYFIAVLDENDDILMRRRGNVRLVFGEGAKDIAPTQARVNEEVLAPVPAPDAMAAGNYKIVAGFELIPAQLRYNNGESDLAMAPEQAAPANDTPPVRKRHKGSN